VIGWVPVQLPFEAVSVCPSWTVPPIVGGDVFAGAADIGCTTAVVAEKALVLPATLLAVTRTLIVVPTSALVTAYVELVAPGIGTQTNPDGSQLSHWSANVIGVVPVQVPFVALSVCPSTGVPDTVGEEVSAGGVAWTTAVVVEVAFALPAVLVAVTVASSVLPTSVEVGV
jgi:hypothetical protein